MSFRFRFDCLWCGAPWEPRSQGDLEGWAQLCPGCLGRAGDNPFLRGRLRAGIAARALGGRSARAPGTNPASAAARAPGGATAPAQATQSAASAPAASSAPVPTPAFPGDWFLRVGAFERGPVHDIAWQAELDLATRWLDAQPLAGRILEPAAGVGFFSPLLAGKGELHASDPDGAALDRARERLIAHSLRAHVHEADPWAELRARPAADAIVAGFLLGRVRGAGLEAATVALREGLRVGGRLAIIDLRRDSAGGPPGGISWAWHEPAILEMALGRAGFGRIELMTTGRFFVLAGADAV